MTNQKIIDGELEAAAAEQDKTKAENFVVLYDDNHIIVVMKPQNIASCPDESGDENMLDLVKEYVKNKYQKPGNVYIGLVHRLDRPTGGVMVFAKTSKAATRLSEQMRSGDFEKRYLTVVCGELFPKVGQLEGYLKKNSVNNMVYLCPQGTDGAKYASLDYRVMEDVEGYSLVEVNLHTGRTHQIRVQMAGISHPVYGDMRYNGDRKQRGKLALWAYSLTFTHPVSKERMRFLVEPPKKNLPWNKFNLSTLTRLG